MQKKILIYGEDWVGTLPNLLKEDLIKKGFKVDVFDWTCLVPGIRDRSLNQRLRRKVFLRFYNRMVEKLFLQKIQHFQPDTIIVSKGLNLKSDFVYDLKELNIPIHNWNPDDFYSSMNGSKNLVASMGAYTSIISARKHLFDRYKQDGANKTIYADWYYEPSLHRPHGQKIEREIAFVGSWSLSREKFLSGIDIPIDIWGGGWEKSGKYLRSRHRLHYQILSQKQMSKVFNTTRFNINLLTDDNNDMSNLRMFEVPASRGTLITQRNEFSEQLFNKGEGCFLFDTIEDVNKIINERRDEQLMVCDRGYEIILGGKNTFSDRVSSILKEL